VLNSVSSLIIGLIANNPKEYEESVQKAIKILSNLILNSGHCPHDYEYYMIPNPWLQIKLLRLLQYYPIPDDNKQKEVVYNIIERIISNSIGIKSSKEKKNSKQNQCISRNSF